MLVGFGDSDRVTLPAAAGGTPRRDVVRSMASCLPAAGAETPFRGSVPGGGWLAMRAALAGSAPGCELGPGGGGTELFLVSGCGTVMVPGCFRDEAPTRGTPGGAGTGGRDLEVG